MFDGTSESFEVVVVSRNVGNYLLRFVDGNLIVLAKIVGNIANVAQTGGKMTAMNVRVQAGVVVIDHGANKVAKVTLRRTACEFLNNDEELEKMRGNNTVYEVNF